MRKVIALIILVMPLVSFKMKPCTFVRDQIKIENLQLVAPVSIISVINKGSRFVIDNKLTKQVFYATSKELQKSFPASLKKEYFSDTLAQFALANFITALNGGIKNEKQAKKYIVPDSILHLFDTSKSNFVFCTYNEGFIRERKNLVNTQQTMEIMGTLVGYNRRPLESAALMSCFILDIRQKNILYFERDIWQNKDPTDADVIRLQLNRIINHYFN